MRWLKRVLLSVVVLLGLGAGALAWLLQQHPSLEPYQDLAWREPPPAGGVLRISFLGVATLLLDDGQTAILTDGFFSRPGKWRVFTGRVEPEMDSITRGLKRAGIAERPGALAAVITVHSHYDHAMDAPEVAKRTGALLVGSASTANVGRGWGLDEAQIRVTQPGDTLRFGKFSVRFIAGRHAPTGITGGEITAPLVPPARATDYKEGRSDILLVEHGTQRVLIVGSAGFEPGALRGVQADVVLLGIGALGPRDDAYRDALWREVVTGVGAKRVIPIHWDDFWLPSQDPMQPMKPMPPPLDRFAVSMDFLRARAAAESIELRLPPQWQPMDVWSGLKAN
jgi:L-ascorbate metabolism protein UlaG (beta-lactamase superfamily)